MSGFPGRVFDGEGVAMDGLPSNLTQARIDACDGRSMIVAVGLAPVAQVWLLDDGATWSAVPQFIREEAVRLVEGGRSIVLLARRREAEVDVRDGLLGILPDSELCDTDTVGQA